MHQAGTHQSPEHSIYALVMIRKQKLAGYTSRICIVFGGKWTCQPPKECFSFANTCCVGNTFSKATNIPRGAGLLPTPVFINGASVNIRKRRIANTSEFALRASRVIRGGIAVDAFSFPTVLVSLETAIIVCPNKVCVNIKNAPDNGLVDAHGKVLFRAFPSDLDIINVEVGGGGAGAVPRSGGGHRGGDAGRAAGREAAGPGGHRGRAAPGGPFETGSRGEASRTYARCR